MTGKRYYVNCAGYLCDKELSNTLSIFECADLLNEQEERIEKLQRYNKSQELEIVRLHKLADAMSGVLKELGVYDVYDEEQINSVKEKLK